MLVFTAKYAIVIMPVFRTKYTTVAMPVFSTKYTNVGFWYTGNCYYNYC